MGDELKVAVLYDTWGEEEAEEVEASENGRKRKEKEDREEIFEALGKLGYAASYHVLDGRPEKLYFSCYARNHMHAPGRKSWGPPQNQNGRPPRPL